MKETQYRIYGSHNGIEHAIFSTTKEIFYSKFKKLVKGLPMGDYSIYTYSTKKGHTPLFEYNKQCLLYKVKNGLGDSITIDYRISKRKGDNIVNGIFHS